MLSDHPQKQSLKELDHPEYSIFNDQIYGKNHSTLYSHCYRNYLKISFISLLLCFFFYCGNPSVSYQLIMAYPKENRNLYLNSFHRDAKKKQDVTDENLIVNQKGISISLHNWSTENSIQRISDKFKLNLARSSRLPSIYYLGYKISNDRNDKIKVNFFNSYFEDEFGQKYKPISQKEFYKKYTGVSYDWIDFPKIHSFYILRKNIKKDTRNNQSYTKKKTLPDKVSNKKKIYIYSPERDSVVDPSKSGYQIIPYQVFSPRSRRYTLNLQVEIEEQLENIQALFYYRSFRSDRIKSLE